MLAARSLATLRATRVLLAMAGERDGALPVLESSLSFDGQAVRRFVPLRHTIREVVLLHGLTSRGASDTRLVRLARRLASEGVSCWVPHLSGLARFEEDCQDLELAAECVRRASRAGGGYASLLGFSLGGGYALVLAGRSELARSIPQVTVMGAHHDLARVWYEGNQLIQELPSWLDQATESELYAALACAAQRLAGGRLSPDAHEELERTLLEFCRRVDRDRVRQFIRLHLLPHWEAVVELRRWPSSATLSPAGQLGNVRATVALLHAPDDSLVPANHAERNYAELSQRHNGSQSILCTPLIDHVAPRLSQSWRDIPALLGAFARLL